MQFVRKHKAVIKLHILLFVALSLNIFIWTELRDIKVQWKNVPPVPNLATALWSSLGDKQLAYRGFGIMVQNMGDTGGTITNIADYDKERLSDWFMLMYQLDPDSSHIPRLAGYVFAAQRKNANEIGPILDYLEVEIGCCAKVR